MDLPFAALQEFCVDGPDRLPAGQGETVLVAFGLTAGPLPGRSGCAQRALNNSCRGRTSTAGTHAVR
jgi:hypothetical protein